MENWKIKYNISDEAFAALMPDTNPPPTGAFASEAGVQSACRLAVSKAGGRIWRNNLGAYKDERDNFIRYGLANDSAQLNAVIKSSDLIGILPIRITQAHVGTTIGQFVAIECKAPDWKYRPNDERATAQLKFITLIKALGGHAEFNNTGIFTK